MKRGKRYVGGAKLVNRAKLYDPQEALGLCVKTDTAEFGGTVRVYVRLNVDSRHANQQVRDTIVLLNGIGKQVRVPAICKGDNQKLAEEAGVEFAGAEDMVQEIQAKNWVDFDILVITPDMMGLVGRPGKILSPCGLMPNPKAGTVTPDIAEAVKEAKAGRIEHRLDKTNIIHYPVGKVSFGTEKLQENFSTLLGVIIKAKPAASKGQYTKSCVMASTVSPGVRINPDRVGGI